MRKAQSLSDWDTTIAAYLSSRHALGRAYLHEEWVFTRLRRFLVQAGATELDEALFERWRAQFYRLGSSARSMYERTVYNFCRYRRRTHPGCFVPDAMSLARQKPYPLPTIIDPEQVVRLLDHVSGLSPGTRSPLRAQALRLAVVLLYTAGLRRGEVVRLTLGDVDAQAGLLRIRSRSSTSPAGFHCRPAPVPRFRTSLPCADARDSTMGLVRRCCARWARVATAGTACSTHSSVR